MKIKFLALLFSTFTAITSCCSKKNVKVLYEFSATNLNGENFDFSTLKGKKVMIVNTASKCGLTPQYEELQKLYENYKDKNFVVIGFPSNDFSEQEPGTNQEIREFCTVNYGITFPMMEKIIVKGENKSPIFEWLTNKTLNGIHNEDVKWNFQKFLINTKGELEKVISPKTKPLDEEIINWIEG